MQSRGVYVPHNPANKPVQNSPTSHTNLRPTRSNVLERTQSTILTKAPQINKETSTSNNVIQNKSNLTPPAYSYQNNTTKPPTSQNYPPKPSPPQSTQGYQQKTNSYQNHPPKPPSSQASSFQQKQSAFQNHSSQPSSTQNNLCQPRTPAAYSTQSSTSKSPSQKPPQTNTNNPTTVQNTINQYQQKPPQINTNKPTTVQNNINQYQQKPTYQNTAQKPTTVQNNINQYQQKPTPQNATQQKTSTVQNNVSHYQQKPAPQSAAQNNTNQQKQGTDSLPNKITFRIPPGGQPQSASSNMYQQRNRAQSTIIHKPPSQSTQPTQSQAQPTIRQRIPFNGREYGCKSRMEEFQFLLAARDMARQQRAEAADPSTVKIELDPVKVREFMAKQQMQKSQMK
ncbi:hypothetical protein GPJ56_005633 [Histomonas meleagridis]|uniref:uncharacterized protein n=1 Tax=Histomonas meleagridis TaxID=135588 RepID=UPI00355A9136|nr:hypothetical protein GPJ56_005633 [Histomonas meleagridis]KAH0803432.1 hypothetical protein GO595_003776 [Histomonas meleagridis]